MSPIRGVKFLRDKAGEKTAVVIDLRRNRVLWEDFVDVAVSKSRAGEPRERLDSVRARLQRAGRLKRSA